MRNKAKNRKVDIYGRYRRILRAVSLTNKEIDQMREHMSLLARTICEHVWRRKFH